MLGRHKHVANTHLLNQKCKEAAAAICELFCLVNAVDCAHCVDIKVLKQWHHVRAPIQGIIGSDEVTPYLELNVDAEAIAHEATVMARCPKESVFSKVEAVAIWKADITAIISRSKRTCGL